MGQRNVRVVVGQGDLEQSGLLRAVLERDDFNVVGEAANASQLARVLTDEQPDIVVLDDAIGVDAVELAAAIAPDARLVVVWPAAVMPIAGAVRVEPSEVTTALSPTVALAAGLGGFAAIDRPGWIERVKKDPATLREMLAARGSLPTRPSVTELQRRGHRLHPSPTAAKKANRQTEAAAASIIPIGIAAAAGDQPEQAEADIGAAAAPSVPPDVLSSTWNRRLGVIALGGAAAAGALMIALALGPRSSGIVTAEPLPTYVSHSGGPTILSGGAQNPDGNSGGNGGPTKNDAGGNGGSGTTTTTTTGFATGGGPTPHGSLGGLGGSGGGTGSGGGGTGSTGSQGNGSPGGPHANSSHLPGSHGTGKPGTPGWRDTTPGNSGHHNPHGGPPGHETGHGQGSSHGSAHSSGNGSGNASANGNGSSSNGGGGGSSAGTGGTNHGNGGGQGTSATHGAPGSHGNGHANGHANAHAAGDHGRSAAAHRHKR